MASIIASAALALASTPSLLQAIALDCRPPPQRPALAQKIKTRFPGATTKLSAVCSKKDVHLDPSEKHPLPMTTSQEYGWIHTALVKPNQMFAHKLNSCDITRYANAYYSMSGTTPFSKKEASSPKG